MSWVSDLALVLGMPVAPVTLAAAMYGACSVAEKAARPEALRDISRILKDPSWSRLGRASAVIHRVFVWTFGERHLSWRCVVSSIVASLSLIGGLSASLYIRSPAFIINMRLNHFDSRWGIAVLLCLGLIPDYVSLAKARLVLIMADRSRSVATLLIVVCADIIASATISMLALFLTNAILYRYVSVSIAIKVFIESVSRFGDIFSAYPLRVQIFEIFLLSTFFTSIWTILIVLSATVLKLLAPIQRFTAWFFDVDRHPVKAVGIVSAALIMMATLIWSIVRTLI
jgi:hypothetical protein